MTATMQVDFNNVRRKALDSYESILEKLNEAYVSETAVADIQGLAEDLYSLRAMLATIACTSVIGLSDFQDVLGGRELAEPSW